MSMNMKKLSYLSTYTKVCLQLQSMFTKDTERQTGKPAWRILFVQKKIHPPQTSQITKQLFPPQPSKINIYKNINKYPPYAYRTYISYNCSYFSTSKLCHSSLLTSKLACHFLIFYLFFSIF